MKRRDGPVAIVAGAVLFLLAAVAFGSGAELGLSGGTIQQIDLRFDCPGCLDPVGAQVDLKPESLQKRSSGSWITAFVELPDGYDVGGIDVTSVLLCRGAGVCGGGVPARQPKIGDADHDGIPDLKVQFDRAQVIALIADVTPPQPVTFAVSGQIDGRTFVGTDIVRIVDPEIAPEPILDPPAEPPGATLTAGPSPTSSTEPSPTPMPTPTESTSSTTATPSPPASPSGDASVSPSGEA